MFELSPVGHPKAVSERLTHVSMVAFVASVAWIRVDE